MYPGQYPYQVDPEITQRALKICGETPPSATTCYADWDAFRMRIEILLAQWREEDRKRGAAS